MRHRQIKFIHRRRTRVAATWSKVALSGAALAAVGVGIVAVLARRRKQRGDVAENISRWEGEGGHVPDVEPPPVSAAPQRSPHPM